ncbi:hypothetical protein [Halostella salina]|uniref:hypothetical protein n=1 Tax=Halostella salina TaxID=1547897 RepID=UPI0013CED8AC|nr:hypothetical protein [Halostella salina]
MVSATDSNDGGSSGDSSGGSSGGNDLVGRAKGFITSPLGAGIALGLIAALGAVFYL